MDVIYAIHTKIVEVDASKMQNTKRIQSKIPQQELARIREHDNRLMRKH